MADYTQQESEQVRRAVLNALTYVSKADPGFFATFKESAAGAGALAQAPEPIRELLTGGFVLPEPIAPEEFEGRVASDLQAAVGLVAGKDPADAQALRQVVMAAVEQVASASKGVTPEEQAAVDRVRDALGSA